MERSKAAILLAISLLVIVAAVRAPLLPIPLERDEGEYAYIAWRLGHNELPYRDWVDQKPPAVFYVYQFALSLPFEPIRAIHFVALLFSAASVCALFFLALRFMDGFWAWVAAALFGLLSADPLVQGTAANTELFMLCPLILSQIAFVSVASRKDRNILFIVLAGALTGIASMFKQVAIVNWFFMAALYPILGERQKRWRAAVSFVLWSATGLLTVLGLVVLYFWKRGGLHEFVDNVFTHNLEYIGAVGASARLEYCWGTLTTLVRTEAIVWLFAAAGLVALVASGRVKWFFFVTGWLITSILGVSASGYFFPHYFQQLLPPLALAATVGAEGIAAIKSWRIFPVWSRRAALCLVLAILPAVALWPFLFTYSPADAVRKIYPGDFFAEMPQFARRLETLTPPDKRVFVFGAEPELLFYARRASATRYIFLFPLYGPYGNAREKQLVAAAEVESANPPTAVYFPNLLFFTSGTDQYFTDWSRSYIEQNFYVDTLLIAGEFGTAQMLNVASDVQSDVSAAREAVIGAILVRRSHETP
jgi:4-amino-4-deoxy-L-arabinose transferase-like glycosyltransferase